MSLFMLGFFFVPVVALTAVGLLLLVLGHWIVGPLLALVGAFLTGAFWSFPREAWVARPCDVQLDAQGFRVKGGFHGGVSLKWDELDGAASGVRDGRALLAQELVAVTRDGRLVPVAEGEELDSFLALLDVWRAADGHEPLPADARFKHPSLFRLRRPGEVARGKVSDESAPRKNQRKRAREREPVRVQLITCARCGAAACPVDAATTPCLYCGEAVPMLEAVRLRLRELSSRVALEERTQRALLRLLDQPSAAVTTLPLTVLTALMFGSWLFGATVFTLALLRGTLSGVLVLCALAAPLSLTVLLAVLSSLIVSRRMAVRAIALDFAAAAPPQPGKPCECRICGAPLPQLDAPVLRCAYCSASNIVVSARPRAPTRLKDHAKSLEDTLEGQRAEQIVRAIFLVLVGLPALWGSWAALRFLWHELG